MYVWKREIRHLAPRSALHTSWSCFLTCSVKSLQPSAEISLVRYEDESCECPGTPPLVLSPAQPLYMYFLSIHFRRSLVPSLLSPLTGWTMSEIRTKSTLLGASLPGRRIASLERFVPSPPSKVPAEDDGGGLLFGLFMARWTVVVETEKMRFVSEEVGDLKRPRSPYKTNTPPCWFSSPSTRLQGHCLLPCCGSARPQHINTMAVLSSAADGGAAEKVASLSWSEEPIEVETCGRSYWSFLRRARAIDNKTLGNVSAFTVDDEVDEEVRWGVVLCWRSWCWCFLMIQTWRGVCSFPHSVRERACSRSFQTSGCVCVCMCA